MTTTTISPHRRSWDGTSAMTSTSVWPAATPIRICATRVRTSLLFRATLWIPCKAKQTDTHQYYTRGTAHLVLFDGDFEQTLGAAYNNIKSRGTSPDGPPSEYSGDRLKLDWQGNVKLRSDEILILGAEHQKDEITNPISAATGDRSGLRPNPVIRLCRGFPFNWLLPERSLRR